MRSDRRHVIQRQILELSSDQPDALQRIEAEAAGIADRIMLPVIEGCFEAVSSDDAVLTIDRLEIDLGTFHPDRFEKELAERLEKALGRALSSYSPSGTRSGRLPPRSPPIADWRAFPGKGVGGHAVMAASGGESRGLMEMLCYYLVNGRLSWWSDTIANISAAWRELSDPTQVDPILEVIRASPAAATRAAKVLSNEMLGMIFQRADPASTAVAPWTRTRIWEVLEGEKVESERDRDLFWAYCLLRIGRHPVCHLMPELQASIERIAREAVIERKELLAWIDSPENEPSPPGIEDGESIEGPAAFDSSAWTEKAREPSEPARQADHAVPPPFADAWDQGNGVLSERSGSFGDSTNDTRRRVHQAGSHASSESRAGVIASGDAEPVYTGLAGVVILHPFLEELFRARDLTAENQFVSLEAQSTAILLIGYLAAGGTPRQEYELLIPKLLCQLPWQEALSPRAMMDEVSRSDCEALLQAVIGHWNALGNTGPDGLREAFLQREGRLDRREAGWRLRIERKAQDVLLDRLPWGFSTIRLPWMTKTLHVSWT